MRALPVVEVPLQRFGVWRGAVTAVALLGSAALLGWLLAPSDGSWPRVAAAVVAFTAMAWSAASLVRVPASILRWDAHGWSLARLGTVDAEPVPGRVRVAIDLGRWMLLRFEPATAPARPRVLWLPVQRRGLEGRWHALRCAVHAPQAAPRDDDRAAPPVAG